MSNFIWFIFGGTLGCLFMGVLASKENDNDENE